ncbi:DUF3047 domain-containing protein [Marinobacterium aestuariivivens]|uniref:DUF3047 domain-containing protein n=1 Tax=Marinobacterium aestuariivivens TaxID=1698799 RepID=A0ABW2A6F6_9GAMM
MKTRLLPLPLLLLALHTGAETVEVGRFSAADLEGWHSKSFVGHSRYELRRDAGQLVLHASSRSAASGLYREIEIDLDRTPLLAWSWKVANLIDTPDERSKAGDDYPARIYVVFSGGLAFWRTRAINYVWSSRQPAGSEWPNAFAANARMIAVRGGSADVGQWVHECRDVRADYRRLFAAEPGPVDAVALMTDTDNTGLEASAWYGDIRFESDDGDCP